MKLSKKLLTITMCISCSQVLPITTNNLQNTLSKQIKTLNDMTVKQKKDAQELKFKVIKQLKKEPKQWLSIIINILSSSINLILNLVFLIGLPIGTVCSCLCFLP